MRTATISTAYPVNASAREVNIVAGSELERINKSQMLHVGRRVLQTKAPQLKSRTMGILVNFPIRRTFNLNDHEAKINAAKKKPFTWIIKLSLSSCATSPRAEPEGNKHTLQPEGLPMASSSHEHSLHSCPPYCCGRRSSTA